MSLYQRPRSSSQSTRSSNRSHRSLPAPEPSLTPSTDGSFEACAVTATFFVYAQRNIILCLHHDTLAIERRFERHKEHVQWIAADTVSEKGNGRLVVSNDASQMTIVWDLLTGEEVARFASFEEIKVAAWMRNGNIAFGNSQGNVILFEPHTVEHISARTIFDPITALAPASDCRTFAIGYMNGSILIATLQPTFTILHTLSTTRAPSPMNALAWHGSSSKQKSDMLAAQTADGDLRIWSIPKNNRSEPPSIIRVLNRHDNDRVTTPCWFGWSKMGRIVQYSDGLTFVWDVRTKKVTYESVPTVDGIVGIANYGPTASLFTLGRNHTVQQYDLNPHARAPQLVQNVQHVPANLPPSPPISDGDQGVAQGTVTAGAADARAIYFEAESSGEEGVMTMSPLQRIAQEMDQMEDEKRDQLGPLSPVSSRSSLSSRSAGAYGYRQPSRSRSNSSRPHAPHDKPPSPGMMSTGSSYGTGTTFSSGAYWTGGRQGTSKRESLSTRTVSSTSSKPRGSRLRQEVLRSPDEAPSPVAKELFPFIKARLTEVPFVPPTYDPNRRTPDDLRRQMIEVVFGWPDDIEALIHEEIAHHPPGSPTAVLLSKWLGDLGAEIAASMVGSASLSSSDWMLLALSAMGSDSQKKVGEAFVDRLLAKGDIHPAVAILLSLGEPDEAIEAYVSRKYFMEAILLTCLVFPLDWGRQSHLVRTWGERLVSVEPRQPELAVRCFSCTSVESSEPWFSPRAQDAVYAAQQLILGPATPQPTSTAQVSPTTARLNPAQAGLKLITNFTPRQPADPMTVIEDKTPMTSLPGGVTPIDSAAVSPGGYYLQPRYRGEPASAASMRTATPGGYGRKRYPSQGALDRLRAGEQTTPASAPARNLAPMTAYKDRTAGSEASYASSSHHRNRSSSTTQSRPAPSPSDRNVQSSLYGIPREGGIALPSPAPGVFTRLSEEKRARNGSRDRKPDGLTLHMDDIVVDPSLPSGTTATTYSMLTGSVATGRSSVHSRASRRTAQSADAMSSAKIRSIDDYINSLEVAQDYSKDGRSSSRNRHESREGRSTRRTPSETRGRQSTRYVKPAKRSPSSPVSMSPDDPALMGAANAAAFDDERYYKLISPVEAQAMMPRDRSRGRGPEGSSNNARADSKSRRRGESKDRSRRLRSTSRPARHGNNPTSPAVEARGRSKHRGDGSVQRRASGGSAGRQSSPEPTREEEVRANIRTRSTSRKPRERGKSAGRTRSPETRPRERSRSARRPLSEVQEVSPERPATKETAKANMPRLVTNFSESAVLTKKELAAQELEARRLSLVRRPSAPAIPHPHELTQWKNGDGPSSARSPVAKSPGALGIASIPTERQLIRSMSMDPDMQLRPGGHSPGVSTTTSPVGLPATPRAMRHPKYMATSPADAPAVPNIPESFMQAVANVAVVSAEPSPDKLDAPPPPTILPSTTFQPARSSSAPAEKMFGASGAAEHRSGSTKPEGSTRPLNFSKNSSDYQVILPPGNGGGSPVQSPTIGSISEALASGQQKVLIVEASPGTASPPAVLPELQHLAGPPPPPPPPLFKGHAPTHSIGTLDMADMRHPTPAAMPRQTTPVIDVQRPPSSSNSPQAHRRGRGSVSDSVGQRLRNVTTRLRDRSSSRNRAKSPPQQAHPYISAPYETLPPAGLAPQPRGSKSTAHSPVLDKGPVVAPYETTYNAAASSEPQLQTLPATTHVPAPPPPPPPPPDALPASTYPGGYRNPKDIARQLAAEQLQFGAGGGAGEAAQDGAAGKGATPYAGYRNPKELRANMPPEFRQAGVMPGADEAERMI